MHAIKKKDGTVIEIHNVSLKTKRDLIPITTYTDYTPVYKTETVPADDHIRATGPDGVPYVAVKRIKREQKVVLDNDDKPIITGYTPIERTFNPNGDGYMMLEDDDVVLSEEEHKAFLDEREMPMRKAIKEQKEKQQQEKVSVSKKK